jgi:hypothetical protein
MLTNLNLGHLVAPSTTTRSLAKQVYRKIGDSTWECVTVFTMSSWCTRPDALRMTLQAACNIGSDLQSAPNWPIVSVPRGCNET